MIPTLSKDDLEAVQRQLEDIMSGKTPLRGGIVSDEVRKDDMYPFSRTYPSMEELLNLTEPPLVTSEAQYLNALGRILEQGTQKGDRTGTGTISLFGIDMRFDLSKGFPLLTTKKVHWKSVAHELLWFISGSTNVKYLQDNGVYIWDEWADKNGDLGPVYGKQWRDWETGGTEIVGMYDDWSTGEGGPIYAPVGIDQLQNAIETIKTNPDSRRIIVSAWNPADIDGMALPPCHLLFQFYVEPLREGELIRRLSCKITQRSADFFLGVPFNIASYALLTLMVASVCDLNCGDLIWSGGDCHIYNNHIEQVKEQLTRTMLPQPVVMLKVPLDVEDRSIDKFTFDDIILKDYKSHTAIRGKVSV